MAGPPVAAGARRAAWAPPRVAPTALVVLLGLACSWLAPASAAPLHTPSEDTQLEAALRNAAALEAEAALRQAAALEAKAAQIILNSTLFRRVRRDRMRQRKRVGMLNVSDDSVMSIPDDAWDVSEGKCYDRAADEEPIIETVEGDTTERRACSELLSCCYSCADSVRVRAKCPLGCGLCDAPDVPSISPPPVVHSPSPPVPSPPAVPSPEKRCDAMCDAPGLAAMNGGEAPDWAKRCQWEEGAPFVCNGCPQCAEQTYEAVQ